MPKQDDLVQRCRRGDREAQQELYAQTSERIYRLLLRMTASPDTAFDLTQDTYLRAFTRIDQFDGRSSLATWLYRIAVTEALQHLRREKRLAANLKKHRSATTVDSSTEQSVARIDVNEALTALEPTDRATLLLRYQDGLDYGAIAEALECAKGTVGSRLHRARERLRTILGKGYASREEGEGPEHQRNRVTGSVVPPVPTGEPGSTDPTRK